MAACKFQGVLDGNRCCERGLRGKGRPRLSEFAETAGDWGGAECWRAPRKEVGGGLGGGQTAGRRDRSRVQAWPRGRRSGTATGRQARVREVTAGLLSPHGPLAAPRLALMHARHCLSTDRAVAGPRPCPSAERTEARAQLAVPPVMW